MLAFDCRALAQERHPPAEGHAGNNREPRAPFAAPALGGVKVIKVSGGQNAVGRELR